MNPEWSEVKVRICLEVVTANLLGPASKRQGGCLIWACPFHNDRHPSFEVNITRKTWRCWVCGVGGDAAELVMRVNRVGFPDAVRFLAGLTGMTEPIPVASKPAIRSATAPSGLPLDEASSLETKAMSALWEPRGETALAYLRGRGLTDTTIKDARLGWTPGALIPKKDGGTFLLSGITIPWREGEDQDHRLTMLNVRRLDNSKPKYLRAFSDCPLIYPNPDVIRVGEPLIIPEGEFDALLLGQLLPEAAVVTLGSASSGDDPLIRTRLTSASAWFTAHDADVAGDKAAARFPTRAVRVRPPEPDKDWGEVHAGGFNRIRYHWGRYLRPGRPIEFTNLEVT